MRLNSDSPILPMMSGRYFIGFMFGDNGWIRKRHVLCPMRDCMYQYSNCLFQNVAMLLIVSVTVLI